MRTTTHIPLSLVAAILMLWCSSCHDSHSNPSLDSAERIISSRPDSALSILRSIPTHSLDTDADRARYALLYSKALDKNYIDISCDSLIIEAVDYYDRHGDDIHRAEANYYLGRVYENARSADRAIEAFVKAEHYARESDAHYLEGLIYEHIGMHYNSQRDFGRAIETLLAAVENYRAADADGCLPSAYVNLMKSYMMNDDIGNAFEYLGKTRALAEERRDTSLLLCTTLYHSNFLNRRLGSPEAALEVMQAAYDKYDISEPPADHCAALSTIYLKIGDIGSARRYAERCLSQQLSPTMRMGGLRLMSQIELAARDIDSYAHYTAMYDALRDSVFTVERSTYIQNIDQSHRIRQLQERNEELYATVTSHKHIVIAISIAVALSIITALLVLHRKHLRLQSALQSATDIEMQCKRLISMYDRVNADNNALRISIDRHIAILRDIMKLAGNNRFDAEAFLTEFKRYVKSSDEHGAIAMFRNIMESHRPGILRYIAARYPDLNDDDIDLYSLICSGCSVDILCLIYDNSSKYMYNRRTALRKKLLLHDGDCSIQLHFEQMIADFSDSHITSRNSA